MRNCDRCELGDAVIDANQFCIWCPRNTPLCAECFAVHLEEVIKDIQYDAKINRLSRRRR